MTDEELDALEALAKKATPGPWKCRKSYYGNLYRVVQFDKGPPETSMYTTSELEPGDARFIAALDPNTVLKIIAEARKARAASPRPTARPINTEVE